MSLVLFLTGAHPLGVPLSEALYLNFSFSCKCWAFWSHAIHASATSL